MRFNFISTKNPQSICIVDNVGGAYIAVAKRLSNFFDKTYYHSVNQNPFPRLSLDNVGTGYDNLIKVDEFWSNIDQFDIIVFPDIYFNDWGAQLRKMGKQVWGGCESEILETNRKVFKDELENAGLEVVPTEYITGLSNLKRHLDGVRDKWIKISYYRGEMETFHHIDATHTKPWLDGLYFMMGPMGEKIEFQVEDPIKSIAEIGCDGWAINGNYPNELMWGVEIKDCGYIGKRSTLADLPKPIGEVNNKFKSILQKYKHTGFYSNEIRYTDKGIPYYTDAAMRAGSPPSNTYLEMVDNWDEIIIGGCKGELVEPKYVAEYGVEIILKSNYCNEGYLNVSYPPEYEDNIKLKGSFKLDDVEYIIPFTHCGFDMTEFGSVVVVGDNLEDIITQALEIASKVEGYKVEYNAAALPEAIERLTSVQEALKIKF